MYTKQFDVTYPWGGGRAQAGAPRGKEEPAGTRVWRAESAQCFGGKASDAGVSADPLSQPTRTDRPRISMALKQDARRDALALRVTELDSKSKHQRDEIQEHKSVIAHQSKLLEENKEIIRIQEEKLIEADGRQRAITKFRAAPEFVRTKLEI